MLPAGLKPGQSPAAGAKFVICEICDGYIKDLEQLRNHMQWMHKVKVGIYFFFFPFFFGIILLIVLLHFGVIRSFLGTTFR